MPRAADLLEAFTLADAADRAVSGFSGGMRRRLDIAASLVLTPAILFLDEPTTGLDPRGRATVWQAVREVAAAGTTVLLTTQYLDEADQLADRISVMDHGRVIAEGTPVELKRRIGGDRVDVVIADDRRLEDAALAVAAATGSEASIDADTRTVTVEVADGAAALTPIVRALDAESLAVDDLALRRPTLDEVFLHLTDPRRDPPGGTMTTTTPHSPIAAEHGLRDRRSNALREGLLLAARDVLHWVREPWGFVFGLAFNLMLILMFGFLFGGAIEIPGGGDYLAFLMPGMFALAMLFGLESTMAAMAEDAKRGITDRFRSLPIASSSVALGRALADLANSAVSLVVLMIGGLVIGWRPTTGPAEIALAVVLLLWLRFSLLWVGIFLGLRFRGTGATTAVQVLVWPIGFLSTVFVSAETMPGWLGAIAMWNPVSATATAARELFGNPTGVTSGWLADSAVLAASAWPLAITLVFAPLAATAYRRLRR